MKEIKEKIIDIIYKNVNSYPQGISIFMAGILADQILELVAQREKEILEELLEEMPKERQDDYLKNFQGVMDYIEREKLKEIQGFNQALAEIKTLIEQKLKQLK